MKTSYGTVQPFIFGGQAYFGIPGTNINIIGAVKCCDRKYWSIQLTEYGETLGDITGRWFVISHRLVNTKTAIKIREWEEPQRFVRQMVYKSCLDAYCAGIDAGNGFRLVDNDDGNFYYWYMDESGLYVTYEPYDRQVCLQILRKNADSVTVAHKGEPTMFKKRLYIIRG